MGISPLSSGGAFLTALTSSPAHLQTLYAQQVHLPTALRPTSTLIP